LHRLALSFYRTRRRRLASRSWSRESREQGKRRLLSTSKKTSKQRKRWPTTETPTLSRPPPRRSNLDNAAAAATAAATATATAQDFFPISDLAPDLIVTIVALAAQQMDKDERRSWAERPDGPTWTRHSFSFSSASAGTPSSPPKDASPLHEMLQVDF
jgi:hypothetical protein